MRNTIAIVLTAAALLMIAKPAVACSCASPTLAEEVASTPLIFSGKVVKLEVVKTENGVNTVQVTVERARAFKGEVPKTGIFITSDGCCYCASWFAIAETYLFFARPVEGHLATSGCTRTKLLEKAQEEVGYLEQASLPAAAPNS